MFLLLPSNVKMFYKHNLKMLKSYYIVEADVMYSVV